ncbi:hypothetical protein FPCIR_1332 [Fusarium pseudocircinatum]|uniref:Uncharacterized protein n=1 Tax=Fusarium pseudocircinatum TaxID=56676 RepID=A0A8H5PUS9_9HYPO|nr:hypothetical protein FPCIR_1332 [Fusarium pseudocircinatum]
MDTLHDDIFVSYDRDSEPEPEPEPLDSSCTSGKRKCAKCQKLGRRCFRCRLKLALGEESEEPPNSALELVVASQAAQRNDKSEDAIPEPIPKPIKARNETIRPQKVAQNGETPSPIPRYSLKSQLRDCPSTVPENRTESFQTPSHDTYVYDGVITSNTQYYESNILSRGANIQSRANDAHRQENCYLYNHPCSQWKGLAPEPPYYNRSDAEIEVVMINRSWHLVSTKCRVEKYDNSGIEHNHEHRHWAEPSREPPHCNSCRSLEEKKASIPEYIKFYNAKVTFIEQLPWRGYAHAVWVALADTTPSMPGSVLRSTNQHKVSCTVYRDQLYGPGRLVNQVWKPDEPIIPLESVCPSIYDFGRSAVHWVQERITGVKHSDEID